MILEEISVRNWRGYRETHVFRFRSGVNLLVGRNEAGKSTLFEALTRALFDRHNSKTEEIRAVQPLGSSLGPEVTVQFRAGGAGYKVVKRFLQDPRSELYSERQGSWELDHEGDQADARLREVLRGEAAARTAARPEHRGIAQALWYLQSDRPLPEKTWNEGVRQGLQGLVQVAATSPRERAILEGLEKAYHENWTPTGRITTSSEFGRLKAEVPGLEEDLAKLRDKARTVEGYRTDLEESRSRETQKTLELERTEKELASLAERVKDADSLELEKDVKERAQAEAAERVQRFRREIDQIQGKQRKIAGWRNEIQELENSLTETTADAKQEAAASERHARRWKDELEPALKRADVELRAFHAAANLRRLEKDRARLEKHLKKLSSVRAQLQERKTERASLLAPTAKERRRFSKALEELSILDAKVEASAVRVSFEWDGRARNVKARPDVDKTETGEFIVAEPTEFRVQGVGKIRVRSGAQALKDLLADRAQFQKDVSETLRHFRVKGAEGLAKLYEEAHELDGTVARLDDDLEHVAGVEPDAEEELARVKRGIEEETLAAKDLAAEVSEQGGRSIRNQVTSKDKEREHLIREIAREQNREKKSHQKHLDFLKTRETISNTMAGRNAQIKTHAEAIAEALQEYGTLDQLRNLAVSADEQLAIEQVSLEGLLKSYEERVETPKRLHRQMQQRLKELERQLQDLRTRVASTLGRIEESAAQGNYSQLADLEIDVERKKRRMHALQRRADGAKLLHDLVAAHDKQRSAALSAPIQDLVNRWLRLLTEGDYDTFRIDEELNPAGVHVVRYDADLPLTSLSHGAKEQIVVLLRLAIGVLISREGPNLVVIDDRLVNADPVRMTRLCLILEEAAKTCQIVIATCNETPYAGLGGQIVWVPSAKGEVEADA